MSLSSSTVALTSWICASAIVAVLHLGWNYLASAFKLVSFCSFTSLAGTSQWSSKGYNSLICRTRRFAPTCIWTALTTSFFPLDNWVSYQSSNDLSSLIHLWSLQYHQYLLFLFCLCGWDCVSLEVLLSIHVSIFSTRSPCIVVHIFAFSSIHLNRCLQWNLLFSHFFQESCCLMLIRLTRWLLQCKLRRNRSNWS